MSNLNKNCGIYKITSPTGRIYIGQSVDLKRRFLEYKKLQNCNQQIILKKSFNKHGVENHQFDIIEYCTEDQLSCSERFWQDEFDVLNGGLNCVLQNTNEKRKVYTQEIKNKMSIAQKQRSKNNINPMKGKEHSEETKRKMSENNSKYYLGKKLSKEHIEKRTKSRGSLKGEKNPNFGKKKTSKQVEELKNIMRNSSNSKKIIDTSTNIIYNSIIEVSEKLNINVHTLRQKLKGVRKNNTTLIYYKEDE